MTLGLAPSATGFEERREALASGLLDVTINDIRRAGLSDAASRKRAAAQLADVATDLDRLGRGDPAACPWCDRDSCPGDCRPVIVPPRFVGALAMIQEPRPAAVIEGVAWAGCTTVLVAESGAGKTFLSLGMAAAVSDGMPWHGRTVVRGSVAYVSFEGDALGLRLRALHEADYSLENVHVLRAGAPISPSRGKDGSELPSAGELALSDALATLAATVTAENRPPIALVIVDTIRASMAGSEDRSEDASAYLRAARRIGSMAPGAAVILVHHAGWQDAAEGKRKRERGSSAFRGNADATLYVEVVEDDPAGHCAYIELRALKVRDEERPAPLRLVRRRVELLATDGRHQPLTSCVIERDTRSREDREAQEAAELDAATRETDARVLRAIVAYPDATSQTRLRTYLGIGTAPLVGALGRLLRAGLAREGKRGEPYQVTPAGEAFLSSVAANTTNATERHLTPLQWRQTPPHSSPPTGGVVVAQAGGA